MQSVQARANDKKITAPLSWNTINSLTSEYGAPSIDFERFSKEYEENLNLQKLVDRFDKDGIVVRTDKTAKPQDITSAHIEGDTRELNKMAKNAIPKKLK